MRHWQLVPSSAVVSYLRKHLPMAVFGSSPSVRACGQ